MIKPKPDEIRASARQAARDVALPEEPLKFEPGVFGAWPKAEINAHFGRPAPPSHPPEAEPWQLPEGWRETILAGLKEHLANSRALRIALESCQHCGVCADKCPFFIGSNNRFNMPVMRAGLIRAVWKKHFTLAGRLMAGATGAEELTPEVIRKWWYYFFQCSACRRCGLFCPLGIDAGEFTQVGRDLLWRLGLSTEWIASPAWASFTTGNHLGLRPGAMLENIECLIDDLKELVGINLEPRLNRKGAETLFIYPSADIFAEPGIYAFMGYLLIFEHMGLDYTLSTFAAEAGNFGAYMSVGVMKSLAAKYYQEAERLKVRWLLAGECGIMSRIMNHYLATLCGPADFLETPRNPATGTVFKEAAAVKMIHIMELTADLVNHRSLKLDPRRNDHLRLTYHDSCNTARSLGLIEEPRLILKAAARNFYEMDEETIREKTFCCGGGGGLNGGEFIKTRLAGGFPRAAAVARVRERYGVNAIGCSCAVDRATLPTLLNYWTPGVEVYGLSELVGNALIMDGQHDRPTDLRGREWPHLTRPEGRGEHE